MYTCRYFYQHMFYKSLQVHQTSYKGSPQSDRAKGRAYRMLIRSLVSIILLKKVFLKTTTIKEIFTDYNYAQLINKSTKHTFYINRSDQI